MAEQDLDRSETATPFKLLKAREQGSVAKSTDLNAAAIMGAAVLVAYGLAPTMMRNLAREVAAMLERAGRIHWSAAEAASMLEMAIGAMFVVLGPLFVCVVVVAVLANLLQSGVVVSTQALVPDLNRINPILGLKKMFSLRMVYEIFKSVMKFVILGFVSYLAISTAVGQSMGLTSAEPSALLGVSLSLGAGLLAKLTLAMFLMALIDLTYTRWDFSKRMRMSQRELKQETKDREGDPRIRARMRDLRNAMLKRSQAARKVAMSDLLITNPTHLAVAITYSRGSKDEAPILVAKGAGEMARKMRAVAGKHGVPIFQNPRVARAIFMEVELDRPIPPHWYPEMARMLVWAYARRGVRSSGIAGVAA